MAAKFNTLTENLTEAFKKSLEVGDYKLDEEQLKNIETIGKDIADAIAKFIQDQTFNITEMKAIVELEQMKTAGGAGQGSGQTKSEGILKGTNDGVLIPKVNFRKNGGQGGSLQTKGYAYIGSNPVGNSPARSTKVKLTKVVNK